MLRHPGSHRGAVGWFWGCFLLSCAVTATCGAHANDSVRGTAKDKEKLQFVNVNGVTLAVRLQGSGIPVVLIHGEGYSHELWQEQVEAIGQNYQFVSYDRRGHGHSDDPVTGYSVIAHAEDLAALLAHFGIRDAHFVVHSRGGAIILQFLRLYPSKVRSITFADATIPIVDISDESAFRGAVSLLKGPPASLKQAIMQREKAKSSSFTKVAQARSDVRTVLHRMVDQYSPRVAMNPQRLDKYSAMNLGPWNSRDFPDMSKIFQPILLIVGGETDIFFIDGAKAAHQLWPNTRLHILPRTDHLLMLEDPAQFNSILISFLDAVEKTMEERMKRARH